VMMLPTNRSGNEGRHSSAVILLAIAISSFASTSNTALGLG